MCACANKGENFGRSDRTRGRLVWFLKNLLCRALRVHHFGRVALVRGKNFGLGVSALFLAPGFLCFPSTSSMTASSVNSVFEESCFDFWSIASSRCPCLRESICAWVSDYSWLSELFCNLLEFFAFLFLFYHFSVFRWCVDNALIKGEIEECWVLYPACDEWIVNTPHENREVIKR